MTTLETYLQSFENYLAQNLFEGAPASLYEPANYMMQLGGKRLRPAMVLMGCDAFKNSFEEALPAALAIEVFHNFTLVHDDIMDAAPLRRGNPTVHKKWDEATAILSGDMMMLKSVMFLQKLPEPIFQDALSVFCKTGIEVCEGQQMDMLFETRNNVSIPEYLDMIALKTSVLLGCSFYLGAIIGGAKKADAMSMYNFGKNLGLAFQLHDDILDAFADDAIAFGKQVGGDIISNKKTYLLITALQNADAIQKEKMEHWLHLKDFDANEKVEAFKELYVLTGAKREAEEERQRFYTLALEALGVVNIDDEKKSFLRDFAHSIMRRTK
jgi:geranylgeranyl diphosphate synthase type II